MKTLMALLFLGSTLIYPKGQVTVTLDMTTFNTFTAASKRLKGKAIKKGETYIAENVSVKASSLKTGLDLRDEHMLERLGKKSRIKIIKGTCSGGKGSAVIEIMKIKKPVPLSCKKKGQFLQVNFKLNLPDFKIKDIRYLGIGVKDQVKVEALVPLK